MNKKNLPLYIALAIPVLMIVILAMAIYLPSWGKKPSVNFVYITGSDVYDYGQSKYTVSGGYVKENLVPATSTVPYYKPANTEAKLFLYDVKTNTASELTFVQASQYRLDTTQFSKDGYKVERGSGNGDFLFGSGGQDYNSWFIKGHNRSKKLNLKLDSGNYYNMQFLGWIN